MCSHFEGFTPLRIFFLHLCIVRSYDLCLSSDNCLLGGLPQLCHIKLSPFFFIPFHYCIGFSSCTYCFLYDFDSAYLEISPQDSISSINERLFPLGHCGLSNALNMVDIPNKNAELRIRNTSVCHVTLTFCVT